MLDRSRMALCAFTFLFLSLNPLAALLCSSGSSEAGGAATAAAASAHHAGRSVLGLEIAGTAPEIVDLFANLNFMNFEHHSLNDVH